MDAYDVVSAVAVVLKRIIAGCQAEAAEHRIYIVAGKVVLCAADASVIAEMCIEHIIEIVGISALADIGEDI